MREEIKIRFNSHKVSESQSKKMERIRQAHETLALLVNKLIPDSREKSLSLTKIEESMLHANCAIARQNAREGYTETPN